MTTSTQPLSLEDIAMNASPSLMSAELNEQFDALVGSQRSRGYEALKRAFDVAASLFILTALSPLLLAVAVTIKFDSKGPALFRQQRVGLKGKEFGLYKFRSMRTDADDAAHRAYVTAMLNEEAQAEVGVFKLKNDPRITRIGGLLRRTSLDEIPQLFNVLKGDMSLVGPRPVLPWEAEQFNALERIRFDVTPGLTGLWQVSGRNRLTMKQALMLDAQYVKTRSVGLDLKIMLATPQALFRDPGR